MPIFTERRNLKIARIERIEFRPYSSFYLFKASLSSEDTSIIVLRIQWKGNHAGVGPTILGSLVTVLLEKILSAPYPLH